MLDRFFNWFDRAIGGRTVAECKTDGFDYADKLLNQGADIDKIFEIATGFNTGKHSLNFQIGMISAIEKHKAEKGL